MSPVILAPAAPVHPQPRRPSDRLSLSITHSDGRVTRWAPDELEAEDIPSGLSYSSSIPGGDKTCTVELKRRADRDYPDLGLYDRVEILGEGNEVVWSGEQAEFPREHDTEYSISVGAVGRSAVLERFRNFKAVYVDRDFGSWGEIPLNERARLALGAVDSGSLSYSNSGGLVCALPNQALGAKVIAEAWYRAAAGVAIEKVAYKGLNTSKPTGWDATTLRFTDVDEHGSAGQEDETLTLDDTLRLATAATAHRYVAVYVYSNNNAATPAAGANQTLSKIAAYGAHGLTLRDNGTEPDGIYLSELVEDVVSTASPSLPIGEIELNSTVVPHCTFPEAVSASEALAQLNKYAFWEWGVYGGEFFFREPDPYRLTWRARLSDGAGISPEGPQSEDLYNGVVVTYPDVDGTTKSVGPPDSDCDTEDENLRDSEPTNALNAWGETKWGKLDLSDLNTSVGATFVGMAWLAEARTPKRRGSLILRDTVEHPTRGMLPVSRVKAGDWITISDFSGQTPRRIVQADYSHDSRSMTCALDSTPFLTEALLELMGVSLVGVL